MSIKIKNRDPKRSDFKPTDIIINIKEGTLFYKNNKDLFKVQGDKISTPLVESNVSSLLGSGSDVILSGSLIPEGFGLHNLGSETHPWKDLHVFTSSIKFYDSDGAVGKVSYIKNQGLRIADESDTLETVIGNIDGGSF